MAPPPAAPDDALEAAVGACSLGAVLVATSARGVCAILLGDDPEALLADLRERFPGAPVRPASPELEERVLQVVALLDGDAKTLDLPLDARGTAFQRSVWEALRTVPAGQTLSYAELARRLGRPEATRAVARAVGANPLAVVVPCHRVVRSDGGLGGYRWGLDRKRALLERERGDGG